MKTNFNLFLIFLIVYSIQPIFGQDWSPAGDRIKTNWGENLSPENVWNVYPRPQLARADWMSLNGLWEYAVRPAHLPIPGIFDGSILVPFCIESSLSGVGKSLQPGEQLWYKQSFSVPKEWRPDALLLHFEAVDYRADVWVNEVFLGSHKGGYDRFSFDITPFIKSNTSLEVIVCVSDPTSTGTQPRGKQQLKPGGIFYTPVSGIWQTVWLERVSKEGYINELRIVPDIDAETFTITPMTNKPLPTESLGWGNGRRSLHQVKIDIFDKGELLTSIKADPDLPTEIPIESLKLWSPTSPFLYDIKIQLINPDGVVIDDVSSYAGMRKISLSTQNGHKVLFLNNKPLFHYGTLDQGWWPDGLYTAPSDEALRYDIEVTKKMGFNMIRKHVKIEPDRWYYHCDKLGMMVWQDMPSAMISVHVSNETPGKKATGITQGIAPNEQDLVRRTGEMVQFELELRRMMDMHVNAPSIVIWVPFNEGWGQFHTNRIVANMQAYDETRLVNPTSGWALRPSGDIYSIHSYEVELKKVPTSLDRASVLGEFGGIGYPIKNHLWDASLENWGYQTYKSDQEYLKSYIYKFDQVLQKKKTEGLSAAVYTQTTDVESEVNGLMTYDRKIIKIPPPTLYQLHMELFD